MILITLLLKVILPVLLILLNLHQYLYNKNPKYYFFFMRRFKKWRDTKWKVHANYQIHEDIQFFKVLEEAILSVFPNRERVVNLKNKKQYNFGDFSLLVLFDLDSSNSEIKKVELNFNPMNVTYKSAQDRLSELRKIFLNIERNIHPLDQNYSMDIHFTNSINPFYGLMIQRLGKEHVDYFECTFDLEVLKRKHGKIGNTTKRNKLRIFKEKITINEKSYDIIEDVSKDILLMG